jgi:type IV pilus assembly protein PilQ
MTNLKLNRMSISILGAILAPVLVANAGAPFEGFAQDASSDSEQQSDGKDQVIDEFGTFEIAVEDVPLPQVLNMLAIQSRRNIITSKRVGTISVTANLFDVTFYEALDGILHIASLCYEEEGNFIYVMTCEEKVQRAEANRVLEDRVFYLDHISPVDAESLAKPLLSEKGSMSKLGEVEGGFQPGATEAGGDGWAHEPVLVVRDYSENLEAIQTLLVDVDTPPKQVMVESTILVTRAKGDYAWGMDVSVLLKADFTSLLNPLNPVSWLQNLQQQPANTVVGGIEEGATPTDNSMAIQSTVGQTTEAGGFKFGILNNNIGVFLRLLDEVSDSTILARPKILALNRQRAQVLVGERVAYLSTTQTETAATQTVQFLETGINLILRPFISRDGSIRMELYPSVSSATLREIGDPSGIGVTTVPDESTNEITTNVRVRDGETVVLGGLFMDETTINRRSVPGLGDVPLVGDAFKGQSDDVKRQEIIFLVTPTIIREEVMTKASEQAEELFGNVLVGVREGLLPWARETLASNSNHDAYQAIDTGDVDLALSHINRSLRNNPNQPEMVQMREDLMGERSIHAEDGDILRGVFMRTFKADPAPPIEDLPVSDPLSSRSDLTEATMASVPSDSNSVDGFTEPVETTATDLPVETTASESFEVTSFDAGSDQDTVMESPAEPVEVAEATDAFGEDSEFSDTPVETSSAFGTSRVETDPGTEADPGTETDFDVDDDTESEAGAAFEPETEFAGNEFVVDDSNPGPDVDQDSDSTDEPAPFDPFVSEVNDSESADEAGSVDQAFDGSVVEIEVEMSEVAFEDTANESVESVGEERNFFSAVFNITMLEWWIARSQSSYSIEQNFVSADGQ